MSESSLSFVSTSSFRNSLIARNLAPYNIPGAYSPPAGNVTYEISPLQDLTVVDSPNNYISTNQFANGLYPLNEYGPEGGYIGKYNVPGQPLPVDSNQGPYDPTDPNFQSIDLVNEFFIDAAYIQNKYGPEGGFNDLFTITDIQLSNQYFQSYDEPFVTSLYKPYQILSSQNPSGTDGTLSQDTFLAKIAATNLKAAFEERIAYETIFLNSQGPSIPLGFGNLNTLNSPFSNLFTNFNNQPLSNRDWKITVGEDTNANNQQFTNRLQENYYPSSPIPGDYFDGFGPIQSPVAETALENINNITGNLGPVLNLFRNPSELFISNTGKAQQSVLFNSLDYNTYRPSYNRGSVSQNLINSISNFLDNDPQITGKYYIGSAFSEPSFITSPPNQVAVNSFGKQQNTIVYGPSELGILYEGNDAKINFGLKGKSITDGGGIMGEFIWTSPKYQGNAGFKVKPGGDIAKQDNGFSEIASQYSQNRSIDFELKNGSILDDTQRIIDAADKVQGQARLKHVGNAINQVSKVFNDGYKELTKGSQVVAYYDSTTDSQTIGIGGVEVGREYCRIFQKDTPYYTYADLQKTDGITTSGRKFNNSVLDNTYNLNIAPMRGEGSTNIRDGKVKKYMFSLENLAWRTSDKPGFTVQDLPECERGPNGGRIMWFPPYDLTFSEDTKASWNPTKFLGRPEPIYTYQNSSRSGSISWRIVVDHPSALNTIIEKQLANRSDQEINSIVDSFFAGCVKYDLYDLAAKYNQIPISELYTYQEILNDARTTAEEVNQVLNEISKQKERKDQNQNVNLNIDDNSEIDQEDFVEEKYNISLYFAQAQPTYKDSDGSGDDLTDFTADKPYFPTYYDQLLTKRTTIEDGQVSVTNNGITYDKPSLKTFFAEDVVKGSIEFKEKIEVWAEALINGGSVSLDFLGITNSCPRGSDIVNSIAYNQALGRRRYDSVIKWILEQKIGENETFKTYYDSGALTFPTRESLQFNTKVVLKNGNEVDCTNSCKDNTLPLNACRTVIIQGAKITRIKKPAPIIDPVIIEEDVVIVQPKKPIKKPDPIKKLKEGISKKILRNLFSECDYFEVIKESNPMIYQSLKDKIKYFNPAFHSTTPEGLNSRLTFLNQCMRPGQTIPVIGNDNQLKYNDALNTSFGTPPVLVLRIGDFYNTKIIPNNLQIGFDPLVYDLNPEGIGVQPMIAKITLSFDFIGGQGLAGPIKQLQNALSFNYYGNTEIYDERSISTDKKESDDRDLQLEKILVGNQGPTVTNKDVSNQQSQKGLTPIGVIENSNLDTTNGLETGEINYYNLMNELQDNSKNYFTSVVNQSKSITQVTNWGVSQLVFNTRNYSDGVILEYGTKVETKLYGKPNDIAKKISNLVDNTTKDVKNNENIILINISGQTPNIPDTAIRDLKNTFTKNIKTNEIELNNLVQQQINSLVDTEQILNYTLRKMDAVCNSVDGVKLTTGDLKIYSLTADPTNNLISTINQTYIEKTGPDLKNFLIFLADTANSILSTAFYVDKETYYQSDFSSKLQVTAKSDRRFYMSMCNILLDNNLYQTFVKSLITEEVKKVPNLEANIIKYCDEFQARCKNDHNLELELYSRLENGEGYKKYSDYKLTVGQESIDYFKDKKVGYTTDKIGNYNDNKKIIKNLYSNQNVDNDKKTFNGKVTFN